MADEQMKRTVQPQVNGWFPLGWNLWNIVSTQLNDNIIYYIIHSTKRWWEVSSGGACFTLSFGTCAWIKLTWRCLNCVCVCVVFQMVACFKLARRHWSRMNRQPHLEKRVVLLSWAAFRCEARCTCTLSKHPPMWTRSNKDERTCWIC